VLVDPPATAGGSDPASVTRNDTDDNEFLRAISCDFVVSYFQLISCHA